MTAEDYANKHLPPYVSSDAPIWWKVLAAISEAVADNNERCAAIAEAMGCDAVAKAIRNPSESG